VDEDDAAAMDTFFEGERGRAEAGEPLHLVPESVWREAYGACEAHGLDRDLLGAQVDAARLFVGPIRFATSDRLDTFVRLWAVSHARLLAGLAGIQSSVQRRHVDELARGFFLLGRVLTLPRDVRANRVFIPREEVEWAGVSMQQLQEGTQAEGMQRLLWKQSVRIRDALAQGAPLMAHLSFRRSYVLKYYWMGALALLNELERRDFDLWSGPLSLSWFRRVQVCLQVVFGRTVT
jgi:phytoene synthase